MLTKRLEQFPILCQFDAFSRRSQKLGMTFFQNALLFQLHGKIQSRLPTKSGNDGIRSFIADDAGNVFQCQRFHIDLIRNGRIRHNGGGIGITEDHLIALLFQRQTGLCAGIVELCCLADDNGTGTDDQYFMDICSLRHDRIPPFCG